MRISVITPSYNNLQWLKLCVASVADQEGVEHEHIIQDACSSDGTPEWLATRSDVLACVEKDAGMYDAINRGFKKATGEVICHLNADEQYLPGALSAVSEIFRANPSTDLVLGKTVVIHPDGSYICSRKPMKPVPLTSWTKMSTTTAALFMKRSFVEAHQLYFDTQYRGVADFLWINEALKHRPEIQVLNSYTSAFTETGENLSLKPWFVEEAKLLEKKKPYFARKLHPVLVQTHRLRALWHGVFTDKPFSYSVYTPANPPRRCVFEAPKPTGIWWQRH